MFTGLIEAVGRIERWVPGETGGQLQVSSDLAAHLSPGESIAVDGVCLTVTGTGPSGFDATISPETLRVTAFASAEVGQRVNLERALRADARLGGHFVLGHVDGVGHVEAFVPDGDSHWLDVQLPESLMPAVVLKGSVAINGISLTAAAVSGTRVGIQIVPFTLEHTALADARPGDAVNVETDVIGKYVVQLLELRGVTGTPAGGGT